MGEINVLDGDTAEALLADVMARNQSLDLIRQLDDGGEDACRSRFLWEPACRLAVEVPTRRGVLVPIRPGEAVEVFFRMGDYRYAFNTDVLERAKVGLSGGLEVPVLILRTPQRVEMRQRRKYYRVHIPQADSLMAVLWHLPEDPDGEATPLRPDMEVLDLSAGGARLLHEGCDPCPLEVGDVLRAALPLDAAEAPAALTARVIRLAEVTSQTTQIGVEFVGLDDTPDGGALRDRLIRHVTHRERAELKRMRGAE